MSAHTFSIVNSVRLMQSKAFRNQIALGLHPSSTHAKTSCSQSLSALK